MKLICLFLILFPSALFAQKSRSHFTHEITRLKGDLNKDKIDDLVIVTQDTLNDIAPYKLEIFFTQPGNKSKLIVSTTKAIGPQYPEGKNGFLSGNGFSDITIDKGVLSINNELLRGHFEHKFRYQNGNFELIGFTQVSSDGRESIETIDFNLSTGIRQLKIEAMESDKVISNKKNKILIRPLPKLQNFVPLEKEYF